MYRFTAIEKFSLRWYRLKRTNALIDFIPRIDQFCISNRRTVRAGPPFSTKVLSTMPEQTPPHHPRGTFNFLSSLN
jgi:hypothetical protein